MEDHVRVNHENLLIFKCEYCHEKIVNPFTFKKRLKTYTDLKVPFPFCSYSAEAKSEARSQEGPSLRL